jgi:Protein of unknown function (DUF1254)
LPITHSKWKSPNPDTLYFLAFLDTREEPTVVEDALATMAEREYRLNWSSAASKLRQGSR